MFNSILMRCLVYVYTIFEDTFRLFLKTCLDNVWSDDFVLFEDMIIPCLKLVYTMYEDMFTKRHPLDGIFTKCLNPYSWEIDPIALVVENEYKFQRKSF